MSILVGRFVPLLTVQLVLGCFVTANDRFHFCALGDMPYYLPADYERFDNVIDAVNAENPVFTVHVGDTKSGGSPCSDEIYLRTLEQFDRFEHPLVYTPGDNEWTDCNREAAGAWNPVERLSVIRERFFGDSKSLGGGRAIELTLQSSDRRWKTFVENRMWSMGGVVFGTIHIVGSRNNKQENVPGAIAEFLARDEANEFWLDAIFDKADESKAPAVALFIHGNPFEEIGKSLGEAKPGVERFIAQLRGRTLAFGKPVLLTHGDSHYFRIDKPLMHAETQRDSVENFTRLEVFGARNMHAVRVEVDPSSPQVFSASQLIVEKNRR